MTNAEAERIAQKNRHLHAVPDQFEIKSSVETYIEVTEGSADSSSPVRDVLAFLVTFKFENSWIELAVDQRSQLIVRVRFSR